MSMPRVSILPKSSSPCPAPIAAPASRFFICPPHGADAPHAAQWCRGRARPAACWFSSPARLHLGNDDLPAVDDLAVIQVQRVAVQRDVQVARRRVAAAQLLVRAGGEQDVAVERTPFLPNPPGVHRQAGPPGLFVEPPADVRDGVPVWVVELIHVVVHEAGIELTGDVNDPASLDPEVDGGAGVGLERVDNRPGREGEGSVDAVLVGTGEQESGRPVVPPARLIGVAILRYGWVLAEPVSEVRPVLVLNAEALRCREELAGELHTLAPLP